MKNSKLLAFLLAIVLFLLLHMPVMAQEGGEAYYIVQVGDSLWDIAARYGVSLEDIQEANNITDPSRVGIGARLIIPGLQGVSGELDTITVAYGDSLRVLSRRYGVSEQALARLNRVISPSEVYIGGMFIVPKNEKVLAADISLVAANQSLLESAVLRGDNPWSDRQ